MNEKGKLERGDRTYNGIPSNLMNSIYDGLIARDETIIDKPYWAILSLYLARTCGVIEAHYKPKAELLEQANKAANKIIEEEINLKTEALAQIEELKEFLDVSCKDTEFFESLVKSLKAKELSKGEIEKAIIQSRNDPTGYGSSVEGMAQAIIDAREKKKK